MTNQLSDIQSQIESFLQTYPESEAVNILIDRLKEYESERQRQVIKADLAWKEQLPDTFPEYPKDNGLREKFRRMFNQLNKQGISVKHHPDFSGKDIEQWLLNKDGKEGRLMWFRVGSEWHLHGFTFVDKQGKLLEEFSYVTYH